MDKELLDLGMRRAVERIIEPHRAQMKKFALANPLLDIAKYKETVKSFSHGKLFRIADDQYLSILLAIIAYEKEPFWKCKISIVSPDARSRKPVQKPVREWSKQENEMVTDVIRFMLAGSGREESFNFFRTPSATHFQKTLTAEEIAGINIAG